MSKIIHFNYITYSTLGLVSFGYGCADQDYPGVYTRITKYVDWIGKRTRDSCFCNDNEFNDRNKSL